MNNSLTFLSAKDVSIIIGISSISAYRLIKKMNDELKKNGKFIIPGKISKKYFEEKMYI